MLATVSKLAFNLRWPITLIYYSHTVDTGRSKWLTHDWASFWGRTVSWQCLSFSALGAMILAVNCSFLEGNPYLKLTVTQRKQAFCASSGLCGISAVRWIHTSFQQVGKQMPPSFQVNPKPLATLQGNLSWEASRYHHRKLLPVPLSFSLLSLKTGRWLFF